MPAPTGTWTINGNGFKGALVLTPDAQGNLSGTVFGDQLRGFWDEGAQKITFIRGNNPSNPNNVQIYTGFLFVSNSPLFPAPPPSPPEPPPATPDFRLLTGYFEAFAGTGGKRQRNLFGWMARQDV